MATVTNVTFKAMLGGLFDQVNDTIQQATQNVRNAGIELEIEAGKELGLAIENARNAYEQELNKTIDRVSKEAKKVFDRLESAVQKFQRGVTNEMQDIKLEAQQIANTLPFSSKQPQLKSVTPRYLILGDLEKVSRVTFNGNFPWSAKPGFEPSLTFGDRQCFIFDTNTQRFVFEVPGQAFSDADKRQYAFRTGKLIVPWDDGIVFSHKAQFEYQVGLGALPQTAGVAVAEFMEKGTERVEKNISSPTYFYDGNNWYPEHWHTIYQDIYPEPDWFVDVTKAPQLIAERVHGDARAEIASVSKDKITVKISLYCKDGHDIGKIRVRVDFAQWQYKSYEKKRTEQYEMNWKDDVLLKPNEKEEISQVVFTAYDGSIQRFAAGSVSDRSVLKISVEGDAWKLWAEAPKEVLAAH